MADYRTLINNVLPLLHRSVISAANFPSTTERLIVTLKDAVNAIYREVWYLTQWPWTVKMDAFTTTADHTTGTVTTDGTTVIAGVGTAFVSGMADRYFKVSSHTDIFKIASSSGATSLTLDDAYTGDNVSAANYSVFAPIYNLPSDFEEAISLRQHESPLQVELLGIHEFRRRWPSRSVVGRPVRGFIYRDTADTTNPWKVWLDPPPDNSRLYDLDYRQEFTDLSAATDQPLMPVKYQIPLFRHALLSVGYDFMDDRRAEREWIFYQQVIQHMLSDFPQGAKKPSFAPDVRHLDTRRGHLRLPLTILSTTLGDRFDRL